MNAPHRGRVLTTKQAAEYTGLTETRLRFAVKHKQIAFVRLSHQGQALKKTRRGDRVLCDVGYLGFCEQDLDDFIDRHRTPAKAQLKESAPAHPQGAEAIEQFLPPLDERRFA